MLNSNDIVNLRALLARVPVKGTDEAKVVVLLDSKLTLMAKELAEPVKDTDVDIPTTD